jgi:hypothetical protein
VELNGGSVVILGVLGVIVGGFVWDWCIFEDFGGGLVLVWGFGKDW